MVGPTPERSRRAGQAQAPQDAHPARRMVMLGLDQPNRLKNLRTQDIARSCSLDNRASSLTSGLVPSYIALICHGTTQHLVGRRGWLLSADDPEVLVDEDVVWPVDTDYVDAVVAIGL